ncbi:MAG: putative Na+/H+ antiporter [Burkholderiaceae bacterium]|jgi:hypothetical protein|nr:putative Na+/H+ antiporter [Burkholderiaceae bacterium]
MTQPHWIEYLAAVFFALALLHTFSASFFTRLSHQETRLSLLWRVLGEVEIVFGLWGFLLVLCLTVFEGTDGALAYLGSQNFTEPLFVFVILVITGTPPIRQVVRLLINRLSRLIALPGAISHYFLILFAIPLLGSFVTEPAAMTMSALMLRERYFSLDMPESMKYLTIAILFVNVSIGGVLTPYAAPPVLMVAGVWEWDTAFMLTRFGWKAVVAVFINALLATWMFRRVLLRMDNPGRTVPPTEVPLPLICIYLAVLVVTVFFSHHPVVFMGLFLLFLGLTEAYKAHSQPLMLREGLLVAFFLAGLVVLGGLQKWWLQALLADMTPGMLFLGATGLTAITDNAALTYLGSMVDGLSPEGKYTLVAGAVTGGGLTVIANAPNLAGFSILKDRFAEQTVRPLFLVLFAAIPTLVAGLCFFFL